MVSATNKQLNSRKRLVAAALAAPLLAWAPAPAAARPRLDPPATDAELMHQALTSCRSLSRKRRSEVDLGLFRQLLDLERRYGVPQAYRGMTLAKACIESGYKPKVLGDCKSGQCKAVGMIQLWPWTQRFGVDRSDPIDSVRFLLERTRAGMEDGRIARLCGKRRVRTELDAWRLAWLRINRGPLRHGRQRCAGTPHGLSRLRQWQRNIATARREALRAERLAFGAQSGAVRLRRGRAGDAMDAGSAAVWSTRPARRSWFW